MPPLVRVKLKPGAVPKLLKSPEMQRKLVKEAKKATAGMPDVLVGEPFAGRNRSRVTIFAQTDRGGRALQRRFGR